MYKLVGTQGQGECLIAEAKDILELKELYLREVGNMSTGFTENGKVLPKFKVQDLMGLDSNLVEELAQHRMRANNLYCKLMGFANYQ